jgi:hypothetical protein
VFYGCLDDTGEEFPPSLYFSQNRADATSDCYSIGLREVLV